MMCCISIAPRCSDRNTLHMRLNRLLITLPYFSGSHMLWEPAPTLKGWERRFFSAGIRCHKTSFYCHLKRAPMHVIVFCFKWLPTGWWSERNKMKFRIVVSRRADSEGVSDTAHLVVCPEKKLYHPLHKHTRIMPDLSQVIPVHCTGVKCQINDNSFMFSSYLLPAINKQTNRCQNQGCFLWDSDMWWDLWQPSIWVSLRKYIVV